MSLDIFFLDECVRKIWCYMKKIEYSILVILTILLFKIDSVNALVKPTINSVTNQSDDLILVKTTKGDYDISYYLLGTSLSYATKFTTSATEVYLSMPNGTYYVWAVDTKGNYSNAYSITKSDTSCYMTGVSNVTGTGYIDMCGVINSKGTYSNVTEGVTLVTCADGYYLSEIQTEAISTTCKTSSLDFSTYNIDKRFCKNTYKYVCAKSSTSVAYNASSLLYSMSLSRGNLSPSFNEQTYNYTATVSSDVSIITIYAKLKDDDASFVSGYEPRTVNLSYGENKIEVKVKGYVLEKENITTYTINITRQQKSSEGGSSSGNNNGGNSSGGNSGGSSSGGHSSGGSTYVSKSKVNTLSDLTISSGELSPKFNSNTNNYAVSVDNSVDTLTIGATLTDSKSSFVDGYGPRTVHVAEEDNNFYIKVKSETGTVRVYRIYVYRTPAKTEEPEPEPEPEVSKALLSNLTLSAGIIQFESEVFDYNVTVSNDIENIVATVEAQYEDDLVDITGGDNLEVGVNELVIKVTSATDATVTNTYTIYIIRNEEDVPVSTNSLLKSLSIEGHAINFDSNVTEYNITINKKENYVNISSQTDDDSSTISIEGNSNLTTGSQIKIRVTAEAGNYTDYLINVTGYEKKSNIFLTIIIIILVILIIAYAVLRALGYKIYFNLEGIKNFFSNLWHSIFTKK